MIPKEPHKRRGQRPDFLRADGYRSAKALGQLYRAISEDDLNPSSLETNFVVSIDHLRSLTSALASQHRSGLPNNRLARKPPEALVQHFSTYLVPFGQELHKMSQIVSTTKTPSEEELFMGAFLGKAKASRPENDSAARFRERTGELFGLLRKEVLEEEVKRTTAGKIERVWAAWHAALRADKGTQTAFGVRSFAFVVLGLLCEWLEKLEVEEKEANILVID
jgi:hypothetical protein